MRSSPRRTTACTTIPFLPIGVVCFGRNKPPEAFDPNDVVVPCSLDLQEMHHQQVASPAHEDGLLGHVRALSEETGVLYSTQPSLFLNRRGEHTKRGMYAKRIAGSQDCSLPAGAGSSLVACPGMHGSCLCIG